MAAIIDELLAATGRENTSDERQQLIWELCAFSVEITKQAMPPQAFQTLRKLADKEDQETFDRFLASRIGDIGAFRRDIDRQFREEYLKPSYQRRLH
jgi:hypothetical protein